MTRRCCVPGCTSNCNSSIKKQGRSITTFSFPKNEEKRKLWIRAIPRSNWVPCKTAVVCCKHFFAADIISHDKFLLPDGTIQPLALRNPKLKEDAVPSVFPNLPKYLSKKEKHCRRDPEERRNNIRERQSVVIDNVLRKDIIGNFQDLKTNYRDKVNLFKWDVKEFDNCMYFYMLNYEDFLSIENSIYIDNNLSVSVYVNGNLLSAHDLKWLFNSSLKLSRWSQLMNLLSHFKEQPEVQSQNTSESTMLNYNIKKSLEYLIKANVCLNEVDDFQYSKNIQILTDQLRQIVSKKVKYCTATVIMAFVVYSQSPSCYGLLREFFVLPHKRYLQSISSSLLVSPESENNNKNYLMRVANNLSEMERIVILQVDEIYISPRLDYRASAVIGSASNNNELAKTVVTFMISSAFGSLNEVVKFFPANNIKGSDLAILIGQVINFVQQCNFEVLCVITDNHSINRVAFKTLASTPSSFTNPMDPNKTIFMLYDFVHIFKNIWKNWLNLKNVHQTFTYCGFEDDSPKYAKFQDIKNLYESEKKLIVKQAYKLQYKCLYPSVLERQKVHLADSIFHHSTISCLKTRPQCEDTAEFLEIIRNWWDIVNNRDVLKGIIKRNEMCLPFKNASDERVEWLKKFVAWLERWHNLKDLNGHLTNETFSAMHQSTVVLTLLIEYIFKHYPQVKYILPGKFTTENLEKRFGLYRLLAGCNYNVSLDDICSGEKKIRIKRIFRKANNTSFSLSEIKQQFSSLSLDVSHNEITNIDENILKDYASIISDYSYLHETTIDESAKIYVSGYASHTVSKKLNCKKCTDLVVASKGTFIENQYFNYLQRGGLSIPTDRVCFVFVHMYSILESIINQNSLENLFLKTTNQKNILIQLTILGIQNDHFYEEFLNACECGRDPNKIFNHICSVFANILLNNYVKNVNQKVKIKKDNFKGNSQKKRKLNTFSSVNFK